jgi:hypothetical protein
MRDAITDELASVVRLAADAVPARTQEFEAIVRRRRAYHRRRSLTTAGLAAAIVAATATAVPLTAQSDPAVRPTTAGGTAAASTTGAAAQPAQRLLLSGADGQYSVGDRRYGIRSPNGIVEIMPDGRFVTHASPGMAAQQYLALPDGRLVMLGSKDLKPGVPREDGPWVTDVAFLLAVTGHDGTVQVSRDVRVMGEHVYLVGATAEAAYLLRAEHRLVRHNLASGNEQPLAAASAAIQAFRRQSGEDVRVSVEGERVALVERRVSPVPPHVRIIDLATGATVSDLALATKATGVSEIRLAPGARLAAIVSQRFVERPDLPMPHRWRVEHRLRIVEVATGRVLTNRVLVEQIGDQVADVRGLAWSDPTTLRVAWYALPLNADRLYDLTEVLQVETVRAPPA